MNRNTLQFAWLALGASLILNAQVPPSAGPPPLLTPTERKGTVKDDDKTVLRARNVLVNIQLLQSRSTPAVSVGLLDGSQLYLFRDSQTPTKKGGFIWRGHGANEPGTTAVFSVVNSVLIGNLNTQSGIHYDIRYVGGGVHRLRELDTSKFPPDGVSPKRPPLPDGHLGDTCSTDPPTEIDALVVYTATSRAAAGGQDAMEATIYLATEYTNQSYLNSNVNQRMKLVHLEEVSYTEVDFQTDVDRLQNPADGFLDNVPTLRNTYGADVVGMIVEESAYCGLAYDILSPVSNAFESRAYAVINRGCAAGNLSFAHEFGHLMGARHDWFVDSTNNSAFVYNHGYVNAAPTPPASPWRTVMAYGNACGGCTRVPFWSNPNINYPPGDPMGVSTGAQQADNHQALNNTALTVANFRCSSPSAATVWMKDTWDDTGLEPDSHTTGEDMWKSPYIWIRNAQDTTLTHQHEHQNPIFGQTNWAYVKIHNGKATPANGNLELYWANASTGLSWPADWHLLSAIPVSGFAAHSTTVVEYQWSGLPGKGHFCMLAKWTSVADPLTNPMTSDIEHDTRYNNKVIWRNLNIVDLGGDQYVKTVSFIIREGDKQESTSLIIRPPSTDLNNSFIRYGVVAVNFDQTLQKAWQQGGARGKGFRKENEQIVVSDPAGAVFDGIMLPPKATGVVTLTFTRLPATPKRIYFIDAVQLPPQAAGTVAPPPVRVTGGVSYEISTELPHQ